METEEIISSQIEGLKKVAAANRQKGKS